MKLDYVGRGSRFRHRRTPSATPIRVGIPFARHLHQVHPHLAAQLHAPEPGGAQSGGPYEAHPRGRPDRGTSGCLFIDDSVSSAAPRSRETVRFPVRQRGEGGPFPPRLPADHVRLQIPELFPVHIGDGSDRPDVSIQELEGEAGHHSHLEEYHRRQEPGAATRMRGGHLRGDCGSTTLEYQSPGGDADRGHRHRSRRASSAPTAGTERNRKGRQYMSTKNQRIRQLRGCRRGCDRRLQGCGTDEGPRRGRTAIRRACSRGHRRLRRPVRAGPHRYADARCWSVRHRRRGHEAEARFFDGQARYRRHRLRGHVRQRCRLLRREAAVFPGLYRLRQEFSGKNRVDRRRRGGRLRAGRLSALIGGETAEMPGFYQRGRIRLGRVSAWALVDYDQMVH